MPGSQTRTAGEPPAVTELLPPEEFQSDTTRGTEELVDVISEHIRVSQHHVHSVIVLAHALNNLGLLLEVLDLLD